MALSVFNLEAVRLMEREVRAGGLRRTCTLWDVTHVRSFYDCSSSYQHQHHSSPISASPNTILILPIHTSSVCFPLLLTCSVVESKFGRLILWHMLALPPYYSPTVFKDIGLGLFVWMHAIPSLPACCGLYHVTENMLTRGIVFHKAGG